VLQGAYYNFRDYPNLHHNKHPSNLTPEAREILGQFIGEMNMICSRTYFNTSGGCIGLGPLETVPSYRV